MTKATWLRIALVRIYSLKEPPMNVVYRLRIPTPNRSMSTQSRRLPSNSCVINPCWYEEEYGTSIPQTQSQHSLRSKARDADSTDSNSNSTSTSKRGMKSRRLLVQSERSKAHDILTTDSDSDSTSTSRRGTKSRRLSRLTKNVELSTSITEIKTLLSTLCDKWTRMNGA